MFNTQETHGNANQDTATQTPQTLAPTIALPKGGAAIRGIGEKCAANPVTGTGSMTVPIATSPGRAGFGPQLSLSYDSGSGNGAFGFGWSLSIPSITWRIDKGLPRYYDAEESGIFILSGAEALVPRLINANGKWNRQSFDSPAGEPGYYIQCYRLRIEGLFARIERWTNKQTGISHWRSISKDNITTLYGKREDARVADPNDPTRIFTWLICESYDDKGSEDTVFTWYISRAKEGFAPAERTPQSWDEEKGPKLMFADPTQSIFLSDMSGDGLTDLVRIRNGEVCYWSNPGYGRVGVKVAMGNAPVFDYSDNFDPKRIRLADIDGSGNTDIKIRNADTGHLDASLRVIGSMRRFLSNIWLWRSMSWVEHGGRLALRLRTRAYFTANLQVFCR